MTDHHITPPSTIDDPVLKFQADTDALLAVVSEQLDREIFDPEDTDLLQQLVERLGDPRGVVRLRVAQTLGDIGEPASPLLIEALAHHPNVVVRRAAAKTIALIVDPSAIEQLVYSFLNDEDTVVQGSAVGALARMGAAAVPDLLTILKSPTASETTRGHAAWALAFIGTAAEADLYREINSDSPTIRAAVVGAIAKVAQEHPDRLQAVDLLKNALTDGDTNVRWEAISAIGNLGDRSALPQILALLTDNDPETRKAAALAAMKIGDRSAISPIVSCLAAESEPAVRTVLQLAISQLEQKQSESDWE
jgi:bilin biosynthesis protein